MTTRATTPGAALRYRAFISYSHRDAVAARHLHRRLESFRIPRDLVTALNHQGRLQPVFLDRDELASAAALSDSLRKALDEAEALIVVCSPAAVASHWVNEEVRYFREHYPTRPLLAFVVDGDPGIDPRADSAHAALPEALALADPEQRDGPLGEAIAADARREADGFESAFLKTAAGLLGVRFDDLRRREFRRRQRQWAFVASVSLLLTLGFAWLAWQASVARARAEVELQSEQQTRQFLLSVFQLADPNESNGNQVTVRAVLDRAVASIDQTEFVRPVVKSRFLAAMGRAYANLGLNRRSVELLQASLAALPDNDVSQESLGQRIDSRIDLAAVHHDAGDYAAALDQVEAANALIRRDGATAFQRARWSYVYGDVLSRSQNPDAARPHYLRAIDSAAAAELSAAQVASIRGQAELGLAFLDFDSGEHVAAEQHFAIAQELLLSTLGPRHPITLSALTSRGANAYAQGDRGTARKVWENALVVRLEVADADAPEVGTLKNNLGRLLLEEGDLSAAEPLLRDALASDRRHRSPEFDDLAFSLHNLAYVRLLQGDLTEAGTLLEEALTIAAASQHRMHAAIQIALADIRCSQADASTGTALVERAAERLRDTQTPAHWQHAQARLVLDYCRFKGGATPELAPLAQALRAINEKWQPQGAFARRAQQQWDEISAGRDE